MMLRSGEGGGVAGWRGGGVAGRGWDEGNLPTCYSTLTAPLFLRSLKLREQMKGLD